MNAEEAIRYLTPIVKNARLENYKEALGLALAALKAQQEQENPKPLTLEELREMDGEPMYTTRNGWMICHGISDFTGRLCMEIGMGVQIPLCDYGKTWLAYRYKPKED